MKTQTLIMRIIIQQVLKEYTKEFFIDDQVPYERSVVFSVDGKQFVIKRGEPWVMKIDYFLNTPWNLNSIEG